MAPDPEVAARPRRGLVTLGILVGLALGALDATIVGPALPTIIAGLHGVEIYFLVTAMFLVTSTSTTPVFGRLLDLYGRRPFHVAGVAVFLVGSALCGVAQSMTQLVVFRGIQGLGAGAIMPASFTMVADLYTLDERPKMQAFVAAVWGLSAIVGPPIGAAITAHMGWRWVFLVNLPIGVLSTALVMFFWREPALPGRGRRVDVAGALLTLLAAGAFMTGCALLNRYGAGRAAWTAFAGAAVFAVALTVVERLSPDPFIVHRLFRIRLFSTGIACGACAVVGLFCATTYITLYMQGALGSTIMAAGLVLLPMTFGWVLVSGSGSSLALAIGYRAVAIVGTLLIAAAYAMLVPDAPAWLRVAGSAASVAVGLAAALSFLTPARSVAPIGLLPLAVPVVLYAMSPGPWMRVAAPLTLVGVGCGCVLTPLLLAAQSAVPREQLGAATSLTQFSRTMVGSVGVAVMGVLLTATMTPLVPPGFRAEAVLDRTLPLAPETLARLRDAIVAGFRPVFLVGLLAGVAGFFCALLIPGGSGRALARPESRVPSPTSQVTQAQG